MIAVVSDVHAHNFRAFSGFVEQGVNARGRMVLRVLRRAIAVAKKRGAGALVIGGDLFDVQKPPPGIVLGVAHELSRFPGQIYFCLGNHEPLPAAEDNYDTALSYLANSYTGFHASVVTEARIVEIEGTRVAFLPFRRGSGTQHLAESFRGERADLLIGHYGMYEKFHSFESELPDYIHVNDVARGARRIGAKLVLMGHEHRHKKYEVWGVKLWQIGALVPTGFRDPGTSYGSLILVDSRCNAKRRVLSGPRFYMGEPSPSDEGLPRYYRLLDTPSKGTVRKLRRAGSVWEVRPSPPEEVAALTEVSTTNVEDAIREYVAKRVPAKRRRAVRRSAIRIWRRTHAA